MILGHPPYNGFAGMAVDEERELSKPTGRRSGCADPRGKGRTIFISASSAWRNDVNPRHVFEGNMWLVAQQKPRREWSPPHVISHIGSRSWTGARLAFRWGSVKTV